MPTPETDAPGARASSPQSGPGHSNPTHSRGGPPRTSTSLIRRWSTRFSIRRRRSETTAPASSSSSSSRAAPRTTSEPAIPETAPKGNFGLNTLYLPENHDELVAHIIFVHGLGGGSEHTWSYNDLLWPRDLLPYQEPFDRSSIHSFGYESNYKKSSVLDIDDFGRSLLDSIANHPDIRRSKCPIMFVGHSMGGLVIKSVCVISKDEYADIFERIRYMVFLATPQRGSSLAPILSSVFWLSSGSIPYLESLAANSEKVQSINTTFATISGHMGIQSFFETRPLNFGVGSKIIVPKDDALLHSDNEKHALLNGDHRSICKFRFAQDPNFVTVMRAMASLIETYTKPNIEELGARLCVRGPPVDELDFSKGERIPGTCEWLSGVPEYCSWHVSVNSAIFWLRGPPGTGKSFVACYTIEKLQCEKFPCCYYLFSRGDKSKSSLEAFLRSMAWQMALLSPKILARLYEITSKDRDLARADHRTLVKRFWDEGIMKIELDTSVAWVIDAQDECDMDDELFSFLSKVSRKTLAAGGIKIFVTTRNRATDYQVPPKELIAYDVSTEDVQMDIGKYLDDRLVKVSGGASPSECRAMKARLLSKSNGSFLWTRFVVSRLHELGLGGPNGAKCRLRVLEEVPQGMNELYLNIVQSMTHRDVELCGEIVTWVTCSNRALTVREMRFVLEQKFDDIFESVEELISKSCYNLVYVDKQSCVRIRHDTAREFILQRESDAEIDHELRVEEAEGHRTITLACLKYLNGPEMRNKQKRRRRSSQSRSDFVNYASTALPAHLSACKTLGPTLWQFIVDFLRLTVLSWIEHLARHRELDTILHTAQVLRNLLRRESMTGPLLGDDFVLVDKWAMDLVKLISKFRLQLLRYPPSIHHLIPVFCPTESAPYEQFHKGPGSYMRLYGFSNETWDDCLCTLDVGHQGRNQTAGPGKPARPERLLSLAASKQHFCIGTSSGRIAIFNATTCIEEKTITHTLSTRGYDAGVLRIQFASFKPLMASASKKTIRIWNTHSWEQVWEVPVERDCLTMAFADNDDLLFAALASNQFLDLDIVERRIRDRDSWTEKLDRRIIDWFKGNQPSTIVLHPDLDLLAVAYRNRSTLLWDYEENRHSLYSINGRYEPTKIELTNTDCMVFSRFPHTGLLAANYTNGDLVLFDTSSGKVKARVGSIYCTTLVSSPDGKILACAKKDGSIDLFDFETLQWLYRTTSKGGRISALTFSGDGTRLLEIWANGSCCRLWDPPALFRREVGNSSLRSPSSYSSDNAEPPSKAVEKLMDLRIIECGDPHGFFFVAKEDKILVYDEETGQEMKLLLRQHEGFRALHYNPDRAAIVSLDSIGNLQVHSVDFVENALSFESLLAIQVSGNSILCDKTARHVLVCSYGQAFSYSLIDGVLQGEIEHNSETECSYWALHPTDRALLLLVGATSIRTYTWSQLQLISEWKSSLPEAAIPVDSQLSGIQPMLGGSVFVLRTKPVSHSAVRGPIQALCLNAASLLPAHNRVQSKAMATPGSTYMRNDGKATNVTHPYLLECTLVIGEWKERLVFLHTDGWVCSVSIEELLSNACNNGMDISEDVLHHFAPPADWLQTNRELLIKVTSTGRVLMGVKGEVSVLEGGLDFQLRSDEFTLGAGVGRGP